MLREFQPSLIVLLRFAGIYLLLFLVYQTYLNRTEPQGLDPFSRSVAQQVKKIQEFAGYETTLHHVQELRAERFAINGKFVSRMVEGCNALSVMILFASFVLAFYKGFQTVWFVLGGIIFLHLMNIFRIMGLNIVLYEYPQYGKVTHDYVFPGFIYGMVVVLWLVWIQFFAVKKR